MAGLICVAQTAEVALTAATTRTIVQVVAPANQRLVLKSWGVSFDGVSPTAEPVQVELLRQATAGTMTSLTPVRRSAGSETVQATAQHSATVEPTAGDILDSFEVHPQGGYKELVPFDARIEIPGGSRLAIRATAPAAVNVRGALVFEE